VEVRELKVGDIPAVQEVVRLTWHDTYRDIIPEEIRERFLEDAYSERGIKVRAERHTFLVAELRGRVVGFADFVPLEEAGTVELAAVYVLPSLQGQGAGSRLLSEGIRRTGARRVFVKVERDNPSGRQFYESRRFRFVRESVQELAGHPLHLVELVLDA
jgi:GNAT superfamily N-acetyltransferase